MHRLLTLAVLALLPLSCASNATNWSPTEMAWAEMCNIVKQETFYTCAFVAPPKVVYKELRPGLYGYYDGGDTVYIGSTLPRITQHEVLVHEMVHYLHAAIGMIRVPGPAQQVCWSEAEAWRLGGILNGKDTSQWWRNYLHCWIHYGA